MAKPSAKSFRATLERINSPLKWVIIRIPFDVHKLWGARGQLKVKGEINGEMSGQIGAGEGSLEVRTSTGDVKIRRR